LAIDDDSRSHPRAKREVHEVPDPAAAPDAKSPLGEGAGVGVVLDVHWQLGNCALDRVLETDPVPPRHIGRVAEYPLLDPYRTRCRHADRHGTSPCVSGGVDRVADPRRQRGPGVRERPVGIGRRGIARENITVRRSFNDDSLRSADVEADNRTQLLHRTE
jgi:hypothetical protein